jgi:hypothetical protein
MWVNDLARTRRSIRHASSASLVIIAAFAMYNWTVPPHVHRLSSAKAYDDIMDIREKEQRIIATKVEIKRKELEKLRGRSEQLLGMLFTPDQAREFFSDIEVIAEQSGCAVHAINLLPDQKENKLGHLGIRIRSAELTAVGLYRDVVKLIRRLQDRTQKVWFDSLQLKTIDYASDKIGCTLTITICQTVDKDTP